MTDPTEGTEMVEDHKRRLNNLEKCVSDLAVSIAKIEGSMGTVKLLIIYVVVPLIVILGGLVGIKIVLP